MKEKNINILFSNFNITEFFPWIKQTNKKIEIPTVEAIKTHELDKRLKGIACINEQLDNLLSIIDIQRISRTLASDLWLYPEIPEISKEIQQVQTNYFYRKKFIAMQFAAKKAKKTSLYIYQLKKQEQEQPKETLNQLKNILNNSNYLAYQLPTTPEIAASQKKHPVYYVINSDTESDASTNRILPTPNANACDYNA